MSTGSKPVLRMRRPSRPQPTPCTSWRVAVAQMTFAPTIQANLKAIANFIEQAARRGADVILFPECAVTGYAYDFPSLRPAEIRQALARVSAAAAADGINVLV